MTNNIFFILIMSLFLNFSVGATRFSGVSRTFKLMFRGVLEVAVATIDKSGNTNPYFNEEILEDYVDSYLKKNLTRYTKHYTVNYYYFYKDSGAVCINHECDGFKISLKAFNDLNFSKFSQFAPSTIAATLGSVLKRKFWSI